MLPSIGKIQYLDVTGIPSPLTEAEVGPLFSDPTFSMLIPMKHSSLCVFIFLHGPIALLWGKTSTLNLCKWNQSGYYTESTVMWPLQWCKGPWVTGL